MSLLLCRQENVRHPFYVEALAIHLYSSQELSYVIFNHPLLVMDDFVNDALLAFLREELNLGFLALKIDRYLKGGGTTDEALVMILSECDYYSAAEVGKYRQLLANFRKKHPADYGKVKADELFSMGQYGKAASIYSELTAYPQDNFVDGEFLARVWNNLGTCYARMFKMDLAMDAYEKAYDSTGDESVLKMMVIISKIDENAPLKVGYQALVSQELEADCEENIARARLMADRDKRIKDLEELFDKDSVKRRAGEEKQIEAWKEEYRRIR